MALYITFVVGKFFRCSRELYEELKNLRKETTDKSQQINDAIERTETLLEENKLLKSNFYETCKSKENQDHLISQIKNKLSVTEKDKNELNLHMISLEKAYKESEKALKHSVEFVQGENDSLKNEIGHLNSEISLYRSKFTQKEKDYEALIKEFKICQNLEYQRKTENDKLSSSLAEKDRKIASLEAKCRELEHEKNKQAQEQQKKAADERFYDGSFLQTSNKDESRGPIKLVRRGCYLGDDGCRYKYDDNSRWHGPDGRYCYAPNPIQFLGYY